MTNPLSKMSNIDGGFYCHSMINDNKHKTNEKINYNPPFDNLSSQSGYNGKNGTPSMQKTMFKIERAALDKENLASLIQYH